MSDVSFVVELVGSVEAQPYKHFARLSDASAYAARAVQSGDAHLANIYETEGGDARFSVKMVEVGRAKLVGSKTSQIASEEDGRAPATGIRPRFTRLMRQRIRARKKREKSS